MPALAILRVRSASTPGRSSTSTTTTSRSRLTARCEIASECFTASAWGTSMCSSARSPAPMQVAAAMFTPASLIAAAACASAPGVLSMSMTRSTAIGLTSDLVDGQEALLVLRVDAREHLDVVLEARAAQLRAEQVVDLEDACRVVHVHLDPDRALLARDDPDLVDRSGRERVDVGQVRLQRDARPAVLHVERVGDADDPCLE